MMKSITKFLNTPWTWKSYFKLQGIVLAIYIVFVTILLCWDKIVKFCGKVKNIFKRKEKYSTEEFEL